MNPFINAIFTNLELPDVEMQAHSVAQLTMLLERAKNRPEMNEALCRRFLPEELIQLQLGPNEIDEVFNCGWCMMKSHKLLRGTKMSLFWLMTNMGEPRHGDAILEFFSKFAGSLNEQEAFSSLAVLKLFFRRHKTDMNRLLRLLDRYNFVSLVQKLPVKSSDRLQQSVTNLSRYLDSLRS